MSGGGGSGHPSILTCVEVKELYWCIWDNWGVGINEITLKMSISHGKKCWKMV